MAIALQTIARLIAALIIVLALDAAIFRSSFYNQFLEPDSSAGSVQLTLLRERQHQTEWPEPLVLTMGDSQMNYSPKLANEHAAVQGYPFRLTHGGVAGTNPRVWHYLLRELDPTARRYAAIVFPVDSYDDEDSYLDYTDYPYDIHYLAMLLRWSDIPEYPLSYTKHEYAREAWRACLFRGLTLQSDVLALLNNPTKRAHAAKVNREWWPNGSYEYLEEERNVNGFAVDWNSRTLTYPQGADDVFRRSAKTALMQPSAPQTGRFGDYRRKWFGKILERYANSPTKIIFVRLPRGPIVRPAIPTLSHSIRDFAQRKGVLLSEESRYELLERTQFFKDPLHMNRAGSTRFGAMLADELARMLSAL